MGLKQFQINLANNIEVLTAGQLLQGQISLELDKPTKAKGIQLEIVGQAKVHWTEQKSSGSGSDTTTRTKHYRSYEYYIVHKELLWGNGEDSTLHPAGLHLYPFYYQLSSNLPSSFEGEYGNVWYFIRCVVKRPWKSNYTSKRDFTVISILNLNIQPKAMEPSHGEASKKLCCLCCTSGPITCRLTLDRTGYVPGEFIIVNGEVDNKSNRSMEHTSLKIRMTTYFKADTKTKATSNTITLDRRVNLDAGDTEIWRAERIRTPPLPPTDLINCNIIDIQYEMVLTAVPAGPAHKLRACAPIIIGTVPFRNMHHDPYANNAMQYSNVQQAAAADQRVPVEPSAPMNPYDDSYRTVPRERTNEDPPPSYAAAVLGL